MDARNHTCDWQPLILFASQFRLPATPAVAVQDRSGTDNDPSSHRKTANSSMSSSCAPVLRYPPAPPAGAICSVFNIDSGSGQLVARSSQRPQNPWPPGLLCVSRSALRFRLQTARRRCRVRTILRGPIAADPSDHRTAYNWRPAAWLFWRHRSLC